MHGTLFLFGFGRFLLVGLAKSGSLIHGGKIQRHVLLSFSEAAQQDWVPCHNGNLLINMKYFIDFSPYPSLYTMPHNASEDHLLNKLHPNPCLGFVTRLT